MNNNPEDNNDEEILESQEPIFKKILIIILAVILTVLILSYLLVSFPIFNILESISESHMVKNNTINLTNFSIVLSDEINKELQTNYLKNANMEFAACLLGYKEGNNNYNINKMYIPEIIDQSYNHVTFKKCSENTLIVLHSHPERKCIGSKQDINSLEKIKEQNKDTIILIMCGTNRFSIYE